MEENYDISFFNPKTDFSRKNRNLVLALVITWAVSIFGFQILLRVVEKPVPEQALVSFNKVKDNVFNGNATIADKQVFLKSLINLVNKNTLNKKTEIPVVKNAINSTVYSLVSDKNLFASKVLAIETKKTEISSLTDLDAYRVAKLKIKKIEKELVEEFSELNINKNDIRAEILTSVLSDKAVSLTADEKQALPKIMTKFMIHNRSFLTDSSFLGFPFHYFYTAVFLLVLFIGLCYIYAKRIESLNKEFGIED